MNKVFLKGNLTRDPEVREVTIGGRTTTVASFGVATTGFRKDADGGSERTSEFHACEAWDKNAELIGKLCTKGDPILIEGSLKTDTWETEDGTKRSKTKIKVFTFDKLARFTSQSEDTVDNTSQEPVTAGADINF